jgi:hypothetical protein
MFAGFCGVARDGANAENKRKEEEKIRSKNVGSGICVDECKTCIRFA